METNHQPNEAFQMSYALLVLCCGTSVCARKLKIVLNNANRQKALQELHMLHHRGLVILYATCGYRATLYATCGYGCGYHPSGSKIGFDS